MGNSKRTQTIIMLPLKTTTIPMMILGNGQHSMQFKMKPGGDEKRVVYFDSEFELTPK